LSRTTSRRRWAPRRRDCRRWPGSGRPAELTSRLLTGMPNHPTGVTPEDYRGAVWRKERRDGCRVLRTWLYATPNEGIVRKTLGHLSFMVTSVLLGGWRTGPVDVVVVSSPTFFSIGSAWLLARLRRARLVVDVRDLWPAIFVELGVLTNRRVIALLERLAGAGRLPSFGRGGGRLRRAKFIAQPGPSSVHTAKGQAVGRTRVSGVHVLPRTASGGARRAGGSVRGRPLPPSAAGSVASRANPADTGARPVEEQVATAPRRPIAGPTCRCTGLQPSGARALAARVLVALVLVRAQRVGRCLCLDQRCATWSRRAQGGPAARPKPRRAYRGRSASFHCAS